MDTVDKCFQSHIDAEEEFASKRVKAEEDFTKKIEDLRVDGAKNYASTKIRMETEIQELEKYYEEMKALYQLNTEKLDYNLKVLREKKDENNKMLADMTKKERQLSNRLRLLKEEYDKAEKSFKEQNKSLTQDYKRITRQFKELQRKFKHFEKADLDQYN
jgi:dynein regulatory complex protein 1